MNPLTVLTGDMIMRKREQMQRLDGSLCLDEAGRYRLSLDSNHAPIALQLNGEPHALRVVGEDAACAEDERAVVLGPASLSLQSLIQLRQTTGHPVLLAENGQVLGVCGETEIIRALGMRSR